MDLKVEVEIGEDVKRLRSMSIFRRYMQRILREVGFFILGRSGGGGSILSEAVGNRRNAAFRRSFAKVGGSNKKVAAYQDYSDEYFERKQKQVGSQMNWLMLEGNLFEDAVEKAGIKATPNNVTITARGGKSKAYQHVHQKDGEPTYPIKGVPARPPYSFDDTDEKSISIFIQKRFLSLFKGKATVSTS